MSILTTSNLAKSYGPQDVFAGVSLEIPRGARIALVGPNGCGKTTLLRLLAGLETPSAGAIHRTRGLRIGYLPQQADLPGAGTLWEEMLPPFADLQAQAAELRRLEDAMADPLTRQEALRRYGPALEAFELAGGYTYEQRVAQVLSGLGFDRQDFSRPVAHLSGGQKTRAMLARLLLEQPDLLLLDEPTNHLDLPSQEVLQAALADFCGTLLIVTHDRYLIRRLATVVWAIEDGRLWEFKEGYDEYRAWEVQQRQGARAPRESSPERSEREAMRAAEREAARRARRRVELEQAIQQLEARLAQLEAQLAAASERQEVERVRQLGQEHVEIKAELDTLLAAWAEE